MRFVARLKASGCCLLLSIFAGHFAQGQIWTGLGDGETWLDGSNWDNGIAPQVPGDSTTFDGAFATLTQPVQMTNNIAISALAVVNSAGDVVIADDEPFHPFLMFTLDGGGGIVPIKLDPSGGQSLTFDRSIAALQFNDDVQVDHAGSSAEVFRIESPVFGGKSLTLVPGTGRVELAGPGFQLNNLHTELETQLGDSAAVGSQTSFSLSGDFSISSLGKVSSRAFVQAVGDIVDDGKLVMESGAFLSGTNLVGLGSMDVMDFATVHVPGSAALYKGPVNVVGGTLSVGSPFGGPAGQVVLHQFATIGTTAPVYNPAGDPAVVVDPGVVTPGTIGLAIDNMPAYALPIDLNFNNGVANSYRLGSPNLAMISFGTVITPFDNGISQPVYYFGGTGQLFVDTTLTDSPLSGNSTALIMPSFPTSEPGVNFGAIILHQFTSFTGPVRVEQEQLVLSHPLAVAAAASMEIVAQSPQFDGGNYAHGTIVLDPGLIGSYAGPAPRLNGGALGFTGPYILGALPTVGGLLGPATFDASNFGGGSPASTLMALGGGGGVITQDPTFVIDNSLSSSGNPVVLVITDQASVELTRPNLHTGGTAVVGHSLLAISDGNQLGPGPLNIADGATLRVTASTTIFNELDLHDATAFGNSTIEVPTGISADFKGNMSTKDAQQGTITKRGPGRLALDPAPPWLPFSAENSWGLRLVEGEVVLGQLPEWEDPALRWQTGPLILDSINGSLFVTASTVTNATNPSNAGFRLLSVGSGIGGTRVTVDAGAELKLAGVDGHHEIYGGLQKLGPGVLWLGGDSSGGDAVGANYTGRGDLDIREGTVRIGHLPGTDDLGRAFPDDVVLRIQNHAALIKEQDQPGQVQSLYINDASAGGIAEMTLFGGISPLGDGSLNVNLDSLGTLDVSGTLHKLGNAPLRFSAQPGATIHLAPGANLLIDDGSVEVDGSGIDPFTDTVTAASLAVANNSATNGLRVTAGNVRILGLTGSGQTRVDTGARLQVATLFNVQNSFVINGEIVAPVVFVDELLTGRGQVTGDVYLNGTASLAPNDDVNPLAPAPATLTITGSLTMGLTDEVNIDVAGASATNDLIDLGGTANLDGTLTIDVHSPFNSLGTTSHLILDAAGGIGSKFNVTPSVGDYLGSGVEFAGITYAASGSVIVDLTQTAYADFNEDLAVDLSDLVIWQANYGSTGAGIHSLGDADLDGDVDGRDFLTWQRQFGTVFVVPPSITPVAVPEPSTVMLAGGALLLSCLRCLRAAQSGLQVVTSPKLAFAVQPHRGMGR